MQFRTTRVLTSATTLALLVACSAGSGEPVDEHAQALPGGPAFPPPLPPPPLPDPPSCETRCGKTGWPIASGSDPCSCAPGCEADGTCCDDYAAMCPAEVNSCRGSCGGRAPGGCWCDEACTRYGDCCSNKPAACDGWPRVVDGAISNTLGVATRAESVAVAGYVGNYLGVPGHYFTGEGADFGGESAGPWSRNIIQDGYVANYSSSGQLKWLHVFGGRQQVWARDVAVDGQGFVYAVGHFRGKADFGDGNQHTSAGEEDGFILALSPSGDMLWVRLLSDSVAEHCTQIVVGNQRQPRVACNRGARELVIALDAAGNVQWSREFPSYGPLQLALGGADEDLFVGLSFTGTVDVGTGPVTSSGDTDVLVARYDLSGTPVGHPTAFGGAGRDVITGLAADDWGNLFAGGAFTRPMTIGDDSIEPSGVWEGVSTHAGAWLASFSPGGRPRWARSLHGALADHRLARGPRVDVDPAGNLWMVINSRGADLGGATVSPSSDAAVLASYTTTGTLRSYATATNAFSEAVATDRWGRAYLAGSGKGDLGFSDGSLVSRARQSALLFRRPE